MDMETHSTANQQTKEALKQKLLTYKADMNEMKKEFEKVKEDSGRHELFGDLQDDVLV